MKVKEIMMENPAFATLNTSLHDVAQMMMDNDCGCIPVVENRDSRKPLGVITDRDITLRTVAHNKNPLNMVAGEIITDNIVTVTPETSVEDCIAAEKANDIPTRRNPQIFTVFRFPGSKPGAHQLDVNGRPETDRAQNQRRIS